MSDTQTKRATSMQRTRSRHRFLAGGATAVALVASVVTATQAWARPHHDGWSMDQGIPADRIERRVDRMLQRVDATPDQQAKVNAIIESAVKDIDPVRKSMSGTQEKIRGLLLAPQVDRNAVEALRSQRVAALDQASQRVTKAMEDAADVLTPDQRQKLATIAADRAAHHHREH